MKEILNRREDCCSVVCSPAVSIVVPVYKVEKYLTECIDSILAQTFTDFELILVDDGSPDNSGKICDDYAARDSRIRVFHKENGGVSSARNFGIDNALGEWITFVDSDDFISSTFLYEMYAPVAKDKTLSFVCCGCVNYSDGGTITPNQQYDTFGGDDKSFVFENFRGLVFSKFFRKDILEKHNLKFDERIKLAEDYIFTLEYIFHIERYAFVSGTGYFYRYREGSATNSKGRIPYHDGLYLCIKKRIDLTENYIDLHNPTDGSKKKRRQLAARCLGGLLSLYQYDLSIDKRADIFSLFWGKKYSLLLGDSGLSLGRRVLLRALISKKSFQITDYILASSVKMLRWFYCT